VDGQHRNNQEAAHPTVAGPVLDGSGEIIGAVELAESLVDVQKLLRELSQVEAGRLGQAIDATGVV
jgi:hypothetical protein